MNKKYKYPEPYESFIKRMKDDHGIDFIVEVPGNDLIVTMLRNGAELQTTKYSMSYLLSIVGKLKRAPVDHLGRVKKCIQEAVRYTATKYLYN